MRRWNGIESILTKMKKAVGDRSIEIKLRNKVACKEKSPQKRAFGICKNYSSAMPAALHVEMVSSSQIEDCTSPMCALPSSSIHSLD